MNAYSAAQTKRLAAEDALDDEVTKYAADVAKARAARRAATLSDAPLTKVVTPPNSAAHEEKLEILVGRVRRLRTAETAAALAVEAAAKLHLGEAMTKHAAEAEAACIAAAEEALTAALAALEGAYAARNRVLWSRYGMVERAIAERGLTGTGTLPVDRKVNNQISTGADERAIDVLRTQLWRLAEERTTLLGPIGWDNVGVPTSVPLAEARQMTRGPLVPAMDGGTSRPVVMGQDPDAGESTSFYNTARG